MSHKEKAKDIEKCIKKIYSLILTEKQAQNMVANGLPRSQSEPIINQVCADLNLKSEWIKKIIYAL